MKKFLVLAALAGLLCAAPALAEVAYVPLKADTVALYAADSSGVIPVSQAKRMWIDISVLPLRGTDMNSECDTVYVRGLADGKQLVGGSYAFVKQDSICTAWVDSVNAIGKAAHVIFAVEAREVLPLWATTGGTLQTASLAASVYSDSSYIPWNPSASTGTAATDSVAFNRRLPGNAAAGSTEIQAIVLPNAGVWASRRAVRVDLVDTKSGYPFMAQFASFRWRVLVGPAGPVRLLVVLGYEK